MTKCAVKVLDAASANQTKLPVSHCYTYPVTADNTPPTKKSDTVWLTIKSQDASRKCKPVDFAAELKRACDSITIHSDVN